MQPSEIDHLSTYEFDKYVKMLSEQLKSDREYEVSIAKTYGVGGLLRSKD